MATLLPLKPKRELGRHGLMYSWHMLCSYHVSQLLPFNINAQCIASALLYYFIFTVSAGVFVEDKHIVTFPKI